MGFWGFAARFAFEMKRNEADLERSIRENIEANAADGAVVDTDIYIKIVAQEFLRSKTKKLELPTKQPRCHS
jgi:hypothetical protein